MKTTFMYLLSILTSLAVISSANATGVDPRSELNAVRLVEIKAEYYPNETYYLGYAENADHTINSIFYENNEHQKRFFSFQDLSKDVAIIQTTSGGTVYDLVRLKIKAGETKETYEVTMSYMKNGLFKNRKNADFALEFNAQKQVYELRDGHTDELINRTYVTTNYWGKMAVGIASIRSSK